MLEDLTVFGAPIEHCVNLASSVEVHLAGDCVAERPPFLRAK
jgi:hypothetical protein